MTQVDEFSTRTVAPGLRSAAWESTSAHLLHKVSVATPEGAPIDARIFSTRADGATIAEVWATGHVVSRSPSDIESFPTGAVAIAAQLGGAGHGDGLGRSRRTVDTGDVMMFDADAPFRRAYLTGMHLLMWLVPREDFLDAVTASRPIARVLETRPGGVQDDRVSTLATTMLRGALWHEDRRREEQRIAEALGPATPSTAALLAAHEWRPADVLHALRVAVPGAAPSLRGYFLLAREIIDHHLADPGLGAESVASAIGISERHLSRVLASEGTSAPRLITDRRLARTRRDVLDPALRERPLAELGHRWGLSVPAHFSRVYRDRFGLTPREDRQRSAGYPIPRIRTE